MGERRLKGKVTLQILLVFTLTCPKTFTWGHLSVFDKYLHWLHGSVSAKREKNSANRISAIVKNLDKCKSFTLTWDLHAVYTAIDT